MDLIWRHPSRGELWQGDQTDVEKLIEARNKRIDMVVLTAMNFQPTLPAHYEVVRARLIDEADMSPEAAALTAGIAEFVAADVAECLELGWNVLVSCKAGRNRSGLVVGLALLKAAQLEPDEVVKLVRERRRTPEGPALNNPVFVRIIHDMFRSSGSQQSWVDLREAVRKPKPPT